MSRRDGFYHIPDGHVGWIEATTILTVTCMSKVFLGAPERAARIGQTAAWSIPILAIGVTLVWVFPLIGVLRAHPGLNIIQATRSLAGPLASVPAGVFLSLYFMALIVTQAREISSAITSVVLPMTPEAVVLSVGAVIVVYIVFHGVEVIGRVCTAAGVLIAFLMIVLTALGTPYWSFDSLFPLLGPGLPGLMAACVTQQSGYGELFAIGLLAPYVREKEHVRRSVLLSLVLSGFALLVSVTASLLVFSYPTIVRLPTPFIRTARLIQLGRFFQRMDAVFLAAWFTGGVLAAAVNLYLAVVSMATTFSLRAYRPLVIPTAAVLLTLAILVPDVNTAIVLHYDVVRPYGTTALAVWPLLLSLAYRLKNRRGAGGGS